LGVSTDDAAVTAKLANDVGVTFPLVVDTGGRLSKKFGLYNPGSSRSVRAVALVNNGRVVYTKKVRTTEVPARIAPWVESVTR
jgi:peroxiredoxin